MSGTPPFCTIGNKYDIIDFKVRTPIGATIIEADIHGIFNWVLSDDLYISVPSGYPGNGYLGIGNLSNNINLVDDYTIEMYLPSYQYGVKKVVILTQNPYTTGIFVINSWGNEFLAYAGSEVSYAEPIATYQGTNVTVKFVKVGNTMSLYVNGVLVDSTVSITEAKYKTGSAQLSTTFGQQGNTTATIPFNNQRYGYTYIINSGMPSTCLGIKPAYHREAVASTAKIYRSKIIREYRTSSQAEQFHDIMKSKGL